jgi:hypothetical protein
VWCVLFYLFFLTKWCDGIGIVLLFPLTSFFSKRFPLYTGGALCNWLKRDENLPGYHNDDGANQNKLVDRHSPNGMTKHTRSLKQLLNGLVYIHSKNIVHGDLKLGNCLVTEQGTVKISDFDLSRMEANTTAQMAREILSKTTRAGGGTMPYMAPEIRNGGRATSASDVYSFGVCVLTCFMPDATPQQLINNQVHVVPSVVQQCDPACAHLLSLIFQTNKNDRPTAASLLEHDFFNVEILLTEAAEQREQQQRELVLNTQRKKERERTCCVCYENDVDQSQGIQCSERKEHFLCSDCFEQHTATCINDLSTFQKNEYQISCPYPDCTRKYSSYSMAQKNQGLTPATYEKYQDIRLKEMMKKKEKEMYSKNAELIEEKVVERMKEKTAADVLLGRRNHCLNELLMMKCEHCHGYLEGDLEEKNCLTLKCFGCVEIDLPMSYHCGYCWNSLGTDSTSAHNHLRDAHGRGNDHEAWFGTNVAARPGLSQQQTILQDTKRKKKSERIRKYLETIPERSGRIELVQNISQELNSLEIDPHQLILADLCDMDMENERNSQEHQGERKEGREE